MKSVIFALRWSIFAGPVTYIARYNRYIHTYSIPSHVGRYSNVGIVKSEHNILNSQFRILSIEN